MDISLFWRNIIGHFSLFFHFGFPTWLMLNSFIKKIVAIKTIIRTRNFLYSSLMSYCIDAMKQDKQIKPDPRSCTVDFIKINSLNVWSFLGPNDIIWTATLDCLTRLLFPAVPVLELCWIHIGNPRFRLKFVRFTEGRHLEVVLHEILKPLRIKILSNGIWFNYNDYYGCTKSPTHSSC